MRFLFDPEVLTHCSESAYPSEIQVNSSIPSGTCCAWLESFWCRGQTLGQHEMKRFNMST